MNGELGSFSQNAVGGLQNLDTFTLSEEWALASAVDLHWHSLGSLMGAKPSAWRDRDGDPVYAAILNARTQFNLSNPLNLDVPFQTACSVAASRRPNYLTQTRFLNDAGPIAEVYLLSTMVKRRFGGSNSRLAKVSDLWHAHDHNEAAIEGILDQHAVEKSTAPPKFAQGLTRDMPVSALRDFNAAGLYFFRNFVRDARAAEWAARAAGPFAAVEKRECWFFGNIEDRALLLTTSVVNGAVSYTQHTNEAGKVLFKSVANYAPVRPVWER